MPRRIERRETVARRPRPDARKLRRTRSTVPALIALVFQQIKCHRHLAQVGSDLADVSEGSDGESLHHFGQFFLQGVQAFHLFFLDGVGLLCLLDNALEIARLVLGHTVATCHADFILARALEDGAAREALLTGHLAVTGHPQEEDLEEVNSNSHFDWQKHH